METSKFCNFINLNNDRGLYIIKLLIESMIDIDGNDGE